MTWSVVWISFLSFPLMHMHGSNILIFMFIFHGIRFYASGDVLFWYFLFMFLLMTLYLLSVVEPAGKPFHVFANSCGHPSIPHNFLPVWFLFPNSKNQLLPRHLEVGSFSSQHLHLPTCGFLCFGCISGLCYSELLLPLGYLVA